MFSIENDFLLKFCPCLSINKYRLIVHYLCNNFFQSHTSCSSGVGFWGDVEHIVNLMEPGCGSVITRNSKNVLQFWFLIITKKLKALQYWMALVFFFWQTIFCIYLKSFSPFKCIFDCQTIVNYCLNRKCPLVFLICNVFSMKIFPCWK